jgi:predicted DNA-binding protein
MGRPPLSIKSGTVETKVRLTDEARQRIEALVGPNRMAVFIREAVDAELARRELEVARANRRRSRTKGVQT